MNDSTAANDSAATRRVLRVALATNLVAFLERAFRDIEPDKTLLLHPYVELLCAELMRVADGIERRLILNLPPRHLKSILASVAFPAFLLGSDPRLRIAVVSHSQSLARSLASPCHRTVSSDWYQEVFPETRLRADRNSAIDFETTAGGGRYAASFDTGITGRGFDVIIVDDPLSAHDARSPVERERVQETYHGMIASRLDNPARGAIIVVHQRLHEDDLSGHLLAKGGWRHHKLPLLAEEETTYQIGDRRLWVRPAGDVLLPELFTQEAIRQIRAEQGETIYSTQYQQNPSATEGDLIKREHIQMFQELPPGAREITLSLDTATKTSETSSYSVCIVIASDGTRHYVIDLFRARVGPVELRDAVLRLIAKHKPRKILIEDASSGVSLQAMLKEKNHPAELLPTRGQSKEQRLESVLHYFVERHVFIKASEPWMVDLVNEWMRFPVGRHNDQVDAMSQYLAWRLKNSKGPFYIARGGTSEDRAAEKIFGSPPPKGMNPMRVPPRMRFRRP
jgi:predicted phage terminase large subunit-like protein